MPRKDGTGPDGKGPKTGRGLGPCGGGTRSGAPSGPAGRKGGGGRKQRRGNRGN